MVSEEPRGPTAFANTGRWTKEQLARIPAMKDAIVEGIQKGLFISEIMTTLDITLALVNVWRGEDPLFNEAYTAAEEAFVDIIEKEAIRRAVYGVQEPVVYKGKVVTDPDGEIVYSRNFSDSLMQFILRGRRRSVYGDKREIDASLKFDPSGARDQLEQKLAAAAVTVTEE